MTPIPAGQVDELFGPLVNLVQDAGDESIATPIFEAIASAWFRDEPEPAAEAPRNGGGPLDWETPSDDEWRAAAARAATPEPAPMTVSGLPRRRPGGQLVPPPISRGGGADLPAPERVPDRVRDRLSGYQRGLRQGRHHAEPPPGASPPPPEPDNWN